MPSNRKPKKTFVGRIVYDTPRTPMSWRDVWRIIASIGTPWQSSTGGDLDRQAWFFHLVCVFCLQRMIGKGYEARVDAARGGYVQLQHDKRAYRWPDKAKIWLDAYELIAKSVDWRSDVVRGLTQILQNLPL